MLDSQWLRSHVPAEGEEGGEPTAVTRLMMGPGAKAAAVCARVAHVLEGNYMQRHTSHTLHITRHISLATRHTTHVISLTRALALWDSCSLYRPLLLMIMSPPSQDGEQLASAPASASAAASAAAAWAGVFVRVLCRVTCLNGPFAMQALVIACQVTCDLCIGT